MDIELKLKYKIRNAFEKLGKKVLLNDIIIEKSKDTAHGDYASNAAMKLCRAFGKPPRDVAFLLMENIDMEGVDKIEIAGPGFINFFMKKDSLQSCVGRIIRSGSKYGRSSTKKQRINVEFVSANPTGLLHVGTARGAAIGDSVCRILKFAGYKVTREYYVNDAGNQIRNLAKSILVRYKQLFGIKARVPKDGYAGEDIVEIAKQIRKEIGDNALRYPHEFPLEYFKIRGIEIELGRIKKDLKKFRVRHDVFTSEKEIRRNHPLKKTIKVLESRGFVKREENSKTIWLTTERFGDDKDRVIRKSNGTYTYFMPDICYHLDKYDRGYDRLIDFLGADHHGYIKRMKIALGMFDKKEDSLQIELIQMVHFLKNGQEYKASKRRGDAITLRDVCEEVGVDAMRYFFAMRAASTQLDFDMDLAKEQSSNNPVYYAQYAHARLCSILEQGQDINIDETGKCLKEDSELALLKHLADFGNMVKDAANELAPYKVTNYIHALAELVHAFYNDCRVIDRENLEVSGSRLALVKASKIVLKNALALIGVSAPIHM